MSNSTPKYNPYDFANPVTKKKLFSGREKELNDIRYYLDHAMYAPRPISLALIGSRASGKTSLLNIAEQEAQQRDFCTVRIDLDESHANNELAFFFEFFNAIFNGAVEQGSFGGPKGKTFFTYVDMVTTHKIPENKEFCPFLFPILYAKATMAQSESVGMLDYSIKLDLQVIRNEVDKPIIILMDECDILSKNAPILQKIRNIFMHMEGYMILLAATPQLFPLLDDVFSPIVRQLKRINVQEFKDEDDTERCMKNPLREVNINPDKLFSNETYKEVHELSGGKPYEINLICHVLFRHFQKKSQKRMALNASVLEDIRGELDKSQDLSRRRVLHAIRNLSKTELKGLSVLCQANHSLTLKQLICIERVFYGKQRYTRPRLEQLCSKLKSKGIIEVEVDDRLVFCGNEFERIYTKYFAREQGVHIRISEVHPAITWTINESILFLRNKIKMRQLANAEGPRPEEDDIARILKSLGHPNNDNVFDQFGGLAVEVYWFLVNNEQVDEVGILQIDTEFEWLSNVSWSYPQSPINVSLERNLKTVCRKLASAVTAVGGVLRWNFEKVSQPPIEKMLISVEKAQEDLIRCHIARRHYKHAIDRYIKERNHTAALWHADCARRLSKWARFERVEFNNLGYMFLRSRQVGFAINLLESAVDLLPDETGFNRLLTLYNLGLAYLVGGKVSKAHKILKKVGEGLNDSSFSSDTLTCLLHPEIQADGELSLREEFGPDFHEAVRKALNTIGLS